MGRHREQGRAGLREPCRERGFETVYGIYMRMSGPSPGLAHSEKQNVIMKNDPVE